jgi:hypothetical protein
MDFFNLSELSSKASASIQARKARSYGSLYETADIVMAKDASDYVSKNFDIFLSHNFLDANVVYGLKTVLEENDFSVYVYWVDDAAESSKVTPATADRIRRRMQSCKSLLYATSDNAEHSKWMPWELGYFDGIRSKVAICPITRSSSYDGREYLGLYPFMEKDLWLRKPDGQVYKKLGTWINEN